MKSEILCFNSKYEIQITKNIPSIKAKTVFLKFSGINLNSLIPKSMFKKG